MMAFTSRLNVLALALITVSQNIRTTDAYTRSSRAFNPQLPLAPVLSSSLNHVATSTYDNHGTKRQHVEGEKEANWWALLLKCGPETRLDLCGF